MLVHEQVSRVIAKWNGGPYKEMQSILMCFANRRMDLQVTNFMTMGHDVSKDSFLIREEAYLVAGRLQKLPPEAVSQELMEQACSPLCLRQSPRLDILICKGGVHQHVCGDECSRDTHPL